MDTRRDDRITRAAVRRRSVVSQVMTSLTGGALAVCLVMIVGLFALIAARGLAHFWPDEVVAFTMADGTEILGAIHQREAEPGAEQGQLRLKVGNRDLTGLDFRWIDEADVASRRRPPGAMVFERMEWGDFIGRMVAVKRDGEVIAEGESAAREAFRRLHPEAREARERTREFERG